MYRVDIENKRLIKLSPTQFSTLKLKERYDIEEWIEKTPEILGEELLIICKFSHHRVKKRRFWNQCGMASGKIYFILF